MRGEERERGREREGERQERGREREGERGISDMLYIPHVT